MKNLWWILILGILLRLFLSFSTFHPDIQVFNLAGKIIAQGNILNLYDYLPKSSDDTIKNLAVLNYPPSIYLLHGIFSSIFDAAGLSAVNDMVLTPVNHFNILFNLQLLLLKLPYLLFDIPIGLLLLRLFKSERDSKLVFLFWIFNPINLYATYMMGQFDIIPTFFLVLSIYFASKSKLNMAALALGGGIAFKIFPVFLVIPLIILGKTFFDKIKLLGLTVLPYLLSILPFIGSSNFRSEALFASQSDKSLYASLPVSGGEAILFFPAFLILFYLIIQNKVKEFNLWRFYLIPLMLFFIFTHYHPQWLIWITPFLIMDLVLERFKNILPILLILASWLLSLFFFDPSLTIGLFAPILPNLHNSPSVWNLLNLNMDYGFSRSLLQTILAGVSGYLIYHHFTKSNA